MDYVFHSRKYFQLKYCIRKRLGANTILFRKPNPDFKINIMFLGSYYMVYTRTKNTSNFRITPSIASRDSRKNEGCFFMPVYTGK